MINDKQLMIASLVIVIIGIIALFFVSKNITPRHVTTLSETMLGKRVILNGTVDLITISDGHVFMYVKTQTDKNRIKIVMFKDKVEENPLILNLTKGRFVKVEGEVSKYKGKLEIIADKLFVEG